MRLAASSPLLSLLVLLIGCAAWARAQQDDPLRAAILKKSRDELDQVILKTGIAVRDGADDDEVRAAVYEYAQHEKPAHVKRYKWSGEEMPADEKPKLRPRPAASSSTPDRGGEEEKMKKIRLKTTGQLKSMLNELKISFPERADKEALRKIAYENDALTEYEKLHPPTPRRSAGPSGMPGIDGMAGMMFKSMDKNADGMLSREELASLIESTNAQAQAKGVEAPDDFFASLDANSDGLISHDEADGYFRKMAQAAQDTLSRGTTSRAAPKGFSQAESGKVDSSTIFARLDTNGDGKLSRSEMASIIERANAANKASGQGTGTDDFFSTMDADGSGFVDEKEAREFFDEIGKMAAQDAGSGGSGVSGKTEL